MNHEILRDLGDGLILRRSTAEDTEALAAFHSSVHRDPGVEEPEQYVGVWVRDLLSGDHPTFGTNDFTVVEDTRSGALVSSVCLISQTWSYGGVEFGVGRPELVATHADYRRRGLIRAQFEVIHEWSAGRGELVQAITGIPWYYRQYGYEMAMTLGGSRTGYRPQVPKLDDGQEEPYRLRPATVDDLPFMAQVYAHGSRRYPVACVWDEALWQYELSGKSEHSSDRRALSLIESVDGEPVGFLAGSARLWRGRVGAAAYELKAGVSWLGVTPSVVRYLWNLGEEWASQASEQELESFAFWLGAEHPAYQVFDRGLPKREKPYAWYLRVPDLAGFLRQIAPALERRLSGSLLVGYSGDLKISMYRHGLRMLFEAGKLVEVEPWQPTREDGGDAAFPDLTFLQLLFGYRSVDELDEVFADCWTASDKGRALLAALFPKQPSHVWPVS